MGYQPRETAWSKEFLIQQDRLARWIRDWDLAIELVGPAWKDWMIAQRNLCEEGMNLRLAPIGPGAGSPYVGPVARINYV